MVTAQDSSPSPSIPTHEGVIDQGGSPQHQAGGRGRVTGGTGDSALARPFAAAAPATLDGLLDDALASLSKPARDALVLRFFDGNSFKEVGQHLGITETAAKQRVFRALERLRGLLGRRGYATAGETLAVALAATAVLPAPMGFSATAVAATATSVTAATQYAALVKGTVTLMTLAKAKPAVIAALALFFVGASTAVVALNWPARNQSQFVAGDPKAQAPPANQPIPAGGPGRRGDPAALPSAAPYYPPTDVSSGPAAATIAPAAYAGPPLTGAIQTPDGKPVSGAQVTAVTASSPARIDGPPRGATSVDHMTTAANGKFELKPRLQPLGLFIRSPLGYAVVTADKLKPGQSITLSPWSRIEIAVQQGSRPVTQARVTLYPQQVLIDFPWEYSNMAMLADAQGRLTIPQVPPGTVRLTWGQEGARRQDGTSPPDREIRVQIEPGKTHQIALGGVGRPVTGKIAADVASFNHRHGVIRWNAPPLPSADPGFKKLPEAERARRIQEWENSPQHKAAVEWSRHNGAIYFDVLPNGSFTVHDVPPGDYQLHFDLGASDPVAKMVETHAVARATFMMPEVPGGQSDQPLDIGNVEVTWKNLLHVGDAFPKLAGKTTKGDAISFADFEGQHVLVHVGSPNFVVGRGEIDWFRAVHNRFGNHRSFSMLTVTTDNPMGFIRMQQTFGEQSPPWPTMLIDADKLPEELESSAARVFLVEPSGLLVAKNISAAQIYSILDEALDSRPDPRVTYDYVPRPLARTNPPYDKIPAPSADDAAAGAKVTLVAGVKSADTPRSDPNTLTDGQPPANENDPGNVFHFQASTLEGRVRIDLKDPTNISEIRSYSWHKDTRAAQVYRVYGSDATDKSFNPAPGLGVDPARHGWTHIATVDTRPDRKPVGPRGSALGGRYAVSIADKEKQTLGTHRHLLFQFFVTESQDVFGHTFYSEIDVIRAK